MSRKTRPFILALLASTTLGAPRDSGAHERTTGGTDVALPKDGDFANPFILRDGKRYYAFGTGTGGSHVQVALSDNLDHWKRLADALPALPAWAAKTTGTTWAPSVLRRSGRYVLYYTARDAESGFQCISRAVSNAPAGPYVDASASPLVCDRRTCGAIDPSPFIEESGKAYLLWKTDENSAACHRPPRLWSQTLTEDGLALVGAPAEFLVADRPWEQPIIEAPAMVRHGDRYFLFYSANWYESADYAIGYATCAQPLGPCTKVTLDSGLVRSTKNLLGPGGQEFFHDATGETWMAYHAWGAPRATYAGGGARALRLGRLHFTESAPTLEPFDGVPDHHPTNATSPRPASSGGPKEG